MNRRAGLEEEIPESVEVSERPEWLPEKFENPEAMAKAYQALEAAMSKSEPPCSSSDSSLMISYTSSVDIFSNLGSSNPPLGIVKPALVNI